MQEWENLLRLRWLFWTCPSFRRFPAKVLAYLNCAASPRQKHFWFLPNWEENERIIVTVFLLGFTIKRIILSVYNVTFRSILKVAENIFLRVYLNCALRGKWSHNSDIFTVGFHNQRKTLSLSDDELFSFRFEKDQKISESHLSSFQTERKMIA